jgi:hypothetical protein
LLPDFDERFIEEIENPSYEEIIGIIKKSKNKKASGPDNITAELLKEGGPQLWHRIYQLTDLVWEKEKMPSDWYNGIIHPIHKKGAEQDCKNYRGIMLLNITYKILAAVINYRLTPYAENPLGNYQNGCRASRGTIDNIQSMRQAFEKCYEYEIELHNLFRDFQ